MGEGTRPPRRHWGLLGVVLASVLFGAGFFSALSPSSAVACTPTTNPDGSKTCSQMYSDVPCPTATGSGNAVTAFAAEFVPSDATVTGHTLTFVPNPPCQNATVSEGALDTNASSPPPPAGEKTVKLPYTITCNTLPCGPGTNPQTTFTVTFTQPASGGGGGGGGAGAGQTPPSPPSAAPGQLPGKVKVDPKSGKGEVPWTPPPDYEPYQSDADAFIYWLENAAFSKPQPRSAEAAAKRKLRLGGTLSGSHPAGQAGTLTLQLNGRAKRALLSAGKLTVTVRGTISNAAGSTPFTDKLKLVPKLKK